MEKKMVVVFEELYSGLAEHAAPVIRCLLAGKHEVVIACNAEEREFFEKLTGSGFYRGTPEIVAFDDWSWRRHVDVLFSVVPGSPGPLFRDTAGPADAIRAAMPHGLTDKSNKFPAAFIGHPLGYFNVLLASGEAMFTGSWNAYVNRHPQTEYQLKIVKAGVPKADAFFDGSFERSAVLHSLGLDVSKKTILYAPTFQREASLECFGISIMDRLASLDCNLLVRLHHLSLNLRHPDAVRAHSGRDWRKTIGEMAEKHANLRMVEGDSTPYFVASDIMVSDVSGASFEFMLQDKPVVFMDVPDFFSVHGKDGIAWWGRNAGVIAGDMDSLARCVAQQMENPRERAAERRELIQKLVYRRGDSAEFAVNTLVELVETRDFPLWGVQNNLRTDRLLEEYIVERLRRCLLQYEKVLIFGAGQHTEWLLKLWKQGHAQDGGIPGFAGIVDDDQKASGHLSGMDLKQPEQITAIPDCVILSTDYFQNEMRARIRELWGDGVELVDLYEAFPWRRPGK